MSRLAASTATQTVSVTRSHRHDDDVSARRAEDVVRRASNDQATFGVGRGREVGGEGNGPVPVTVSQARNELAGHACRDQDRARQRRRHEAAGHQRATEFFDRDRELGQAEALAAVGLGHVQAEQPLIGKAGPQRVPVADGAVLLAVGDRPGHGGRAMAFAPGPDRVSELLMFFRQAERHCCTSSATIRWSRRILECDSVFD